LKQSFDAHAQVTGWGSVNSTTGYQPEQLQVGRLEVLNHERCYQREKQFFGKNLKPGVNFCAGGNQVNGTSKFELIYIFSYTNLHSCDWSKIWPLIPLAFVAHANILI
jgi:hypothetical protein